MAITGRFTKPHVFVTATSNPNWPEIYRELLAANDPAGRADLITRVFTLQPVVYVSDLIEHIPATRVGRINQTPTTLSTSVFSFNFTSPCRPFTIPPWPLFIASALPPS
jgi:hypothetical protein